MFFFCREVRRKHGSNYTSCHLIQRDPTFCMKFCRGFQTGQRSLPGIHQHVCPRLKYTTLALAPVENALRPAESHPKLRKVHLIARERERERESSFRSEEEPFIPTASLSGSQRTSSGQQRVLPDRETLKPTQGLHAFLGQQRAISRQHLSGPLHTSRMTEVLIVPIEDPLRPFEVNSGRHTVLSGRHKAF